MMVGRQGWNEEVANGGKQRVFVSQGGNWWQTKSILITGWQMVANKEYSYHRVAIGAKQRVFLSQGGNWWQTKSIPITGWQMVANKEYSYHRVAIGGKTKSIHITGWPMVAKQKVEITKKGLKLLRLSISLQSVPIGPIVKSRFS